MPRFFFNLHNHLWIEDSEGKDLTDAAAAREQAVRHARDIMSDEVKDGRLVLTDAIEVVDERRDRVLTLAFRDAIVIEG